MNVLTQILERRFYYHSYACRKGKGTHRAVDQYQQWANQYAYVMKLDIAQYFPSIRHDFLKQQLRQLIKDTHLIWLLDLIIANSPSLTSGVGLPIGNLTSQYFANLYLNDIDHWISAQPACGAYLRYVDDLILFGDDKPSLWQLRDQLANKLIALGLTLHPKKQQLHPTRDRVDVFGYKISRDRRWLRNDNGYRFRRKLYHFIRHSDVSKPVLEKRRASVMAWSGHAMHGETAGLRCAFSSAISLG